jgi:hypothetical protein
MVDAKSTMLQVRFDTQGKMVSYSWLGETDKAAAQLSEA